MQKLNDFYRDLRERVRHSVLDKTSLKALRKEESKAAKQAKKHPEQKSRVYVLDFDGDIKASATEQLRHEVTAVLSMAGKDDEVVLRLESGGGMVHGYGLAASQLARIRQAGVPLTVCVDKVAASGGYMMACIGDRILSAPFAILGSIGVVAQLPNVHRLLKKHDIDFEVLTAGEYKRTLTVFGENTEKGREKVPGGPGGDPRTVQELRGPLPAATEHGRDRHRRGLAGPGRTGASCWWTNSRPATSTWPSRPGSAMSTRCNSSSARACRNASAWPPAWLSTACW